MNSVIKLSSTDSRLFSAEIASALGDINAAVIVQQLHYWMGKEGVGTIIGGVKYVYNSFNDWVKQFPWLSVWQFRKAMKLLRNLGVVEVIRHKSRQWNQTNYYSLKSDRLSELLKPKNAETIETIELCVTTDREVRNQHIEVRDSELSYIRTKKTVQKETANNRNPVKERSHLNKKEIAAVSLKTNSEQESYPNKETHYSQKLNAVTGQLSSKSGNNRTVVSKQKSPANCSIKEVKKINSNWKQLVEELDNLGVQVNKTLVSLVKIYSEEEVKSAIALLKHRKKEKFIPNMAGYFTAALKGGWSYKSVVEETADKEGEAVDKASVFRLWYELAKELGYCSGQEIRDGGTVGVTIWKLGKMGRSVQ